MKSTDFAKKVKELTGKSNLDDALAAVEQLVQPSEGGAPFGVIIIVDPKRDGQYYSHPIAWESLQDIQLIELSCKHFLSNLEPVIDQMKEQEMREKIRAELAAEAEKK